MTPEQILNEEHKNASDKISSISTDNFPLVYEHQALAAMKRYFIEMADKLLSDFEVVGCEDDSLKWQLCGTNQRYTSEELITLL